MRVPPFVPDGQAVDASNTTDRPSPRSPGISAADMPDRDTPANVFCIGSPFRSNPLEALPDDLAVLIGDWIALSLKVVRSGPLVGKDCWRFDSVTTQLIALVNTRFPNFNPGPFLTLAAINPAAMPAREILLRLHKEGRLILEALARQSSSEDIPHENFPPPQGDGRGKILRPNAKRDEWLFQQYRDHPEKTVAAIRFEAKQKGWHIYNDPAARMAIKRYCESHGIKTPTRKKTRT